VTVPALTANIMTEPPATMMPSAIAKAASATGCARSTPTMAEMVCVRSVEAQQLQRIAADDERDEDEAADDRDRDQGLEQRVGDELDEHNLPIRGRDEGAAFEGELQQSSHSTMTVRMTFPSFVTRAAKRIALGGCGAAAAIAVAALVIERTALGGDLAASRARLQAEVEGEFSALTARLDQAIGAMTLDPESLRRASVAMPRPRASFSIRWRPAWRNPASRHDLRRCQPTPGVARPIRGCSDAGFGTGVDVPGAEQPGLSSWCGSADRRSGRAGAAHRRDRRRSAAAPDRRRLAGLGVYARHQHRAGCAALQFEGAADAGPTRSSFARRPENRWRR
jgi:hypothetical protein